MQGAADHHAESPKQSREMMMRVSTRPNLRRRPREQAPGQVFDLLMATVKKVGLPMAEGIQRGFHRPAQAAIRFGRDDTVLQRFHRSVKQPFAMEAAG